VVKEGALEDDRVDVLAVHVRVRAWLGFVARLHHDIKIITQGFEQSHENLEESLGRDRCGQHRHLVAGLGVAVDITPVPFTRDHFEPDRRAHGIRQQEIPVTADTEVGVELFLAQIVKSRAGHTGWIVAKNSLKEALNETHGKGSPPKPRRTLGNVSLNVLGHRAKRSRGSSPELYHPRRPLDTAPKGSRNPPRGRSPFRWQRFTTALENI